MEKKNNNLIGVIPDLHMKEFLSYADYVSDRRIEEKNRVLDFIVDSFKDCSKVVILGDVFHSKNNSSETNREFVEFIEKFDDKEIYIISGNHEKKGNGTTAIDFLGEVKKTNWHIFNEPSSLTIEGKKLSFLPYMLNSELEVETHEEATKKIMKDLEGGDILFTHHAISDTTFMGMLTNTLKEVVLPKKKLEEKYKLILAGHIHSPGEFGKTILAGSVFTSTVGEKEKFIWKIKGDLSTKKIKLPNREIHKIEDPTDEQLKDIPKDSIVKVIVTKKSTKIEELKKKLSKFDASLLVENYSNKRKKMHIEDGAFDFSIEALLELYAKEKKVDYKELIKGLEIINE